jgi:hypothetical protein
MFGGYHSLNSTRTRGSFSRFERETTPARHRRPDRAATIAIALAVRRAHNRARSFCRFETGKESKDQTDNAAGMTAGDADAGGAGGSLLDFPDDLGGIERAARVSLITLEQEMKALQECVESASGLATALAPEEGAGDDDGDDGGSALALDGWIKASCS